jgi:tetratricopeptide (TPR) repeat protein
MKKLLSFAWLLLMSLSAIGQEPLKPPKTASQQAATELTEDIEVLRRLLNQSLNLGSAKAQILLSPNVDSGQRWGNRVDDLRQLASLSFDGVYLSGHGIVYTLNVPQGALKNWAQIERSTGLSVTCLQCHTSIDEKWLSESVLPRSKTEWEATRDALRGVNEPAPTPEARLKVCEPGNLSARVVGVLFDNLKNIRHLPANQHVSIVVTYEGYSGRAEDRVIFKDPVNPKVTEKPAPQLSTNFGFTAEEVNQLNLGDLHLRQNNHTKAIEAYEQALRRFSEGTVNVTWPQGVSAEKVQESTKQLETSIREVYAKLAQAQLAAKQVENATKSLELAKGFTVKNKSLNLKSDQALPVPAKLIIRVTKQDFDKNSANFSEFRKVVSLETIGLPPATDKVPEAKK